MCTAKTHVALVYLCASSLFILPTPFLAGRKRKSRVGGPAPSWEGSQTFVLPAQLSSEQAVALLWHFGLCSGGHTALPSRCRSTSSWWSGWSSKPQVNGFLCISQNKCWAKEMKSTGLILINNLPSTLSFQKGLFFSLGGGGSVWPPGHLLRYWVNSHF